MEAPAAADRENRIVCVGRWASPQKATPLLVRTLGAALATHPAWQADLYGSGEDVARSHLKNIPRSSAQRVHIHGPKPHVDIVKAFQYSKICLVTSRYESGPISAQEALCLGCTIVGPPDVPSMHDLCQRGNGSLAQSRSRSDMTTAVHHEVHLWENNRRNPKASSHLARNLYSAKSVCRNILEIIDATEYS